DPGQVATLGNDLLVSFPQLCLELRELVSSRLPFLASSNFVFGHLTYLLSDSTLPGSRIKTGDGSETHRTPFTLGRTRRSNPGAQSVLLTARLACHAFRGRPFASTASLRVDVSCLQSPAPTRLASSTPRPGVRRCRPRIRAPHLASTCPSPPVRPAVPAPEPR